jgi:hypothetical protein
VIQTIRQRFRRRMRVVVLLWVAGLLITVLAVRYSHFDVAHPGAVLPRLVPVVGMIVFFVGLILSGTARCPKCLTVVSPWVSMYPVFSVPFRGPPKQCPTCGIGLDEPCPF